MRLMEGSVGSGCIHKGHGASMSSKEVQCRSRGRHYEGHQNQNLWKTIPLLQHHMTSYVVTQRSQTTSDGTLGLLVNCYPKIWKVRLHVHCAKHIKSSKPTSCHRPRSPSHTLRQNGVIVLHCISQVTQVDMDISGLWHSLARQEDCQQQKWHKHFN